VPRLLRRLTTLTTATTTATSPPDSEAAASRLQPDPEHALSDGAQSLTFDLFASVMANVAKVAAAVGKRMKRAAVPA
jgi:3-deoxy-7-phosphoheptulonate synthase